MQLTWCDSRNELDTLAADEVTTLLGGNPKAVLAIPTGSTPLGLYTRLRTRAASGAVSCKSASWFDLDEYVGVGADDDLSYARFVRTQLLDPAGVPESQIRLLRGDAVDLPAECREYDDAVARAGGIDLAILGLGANGHIAFNEPGSAWDRTTHVVELSVETRAANTPYAGNSTIPRYGVTMGIAMLRRARAVLLLVAGASKQKALQALQRGIPDRGWPVTSLLDHPNLTVFAEAQLR